MLINDDGTVQTKGEFLAGVKKSIGQEQQVAPESISVHVFENTAISTGVFRAKGVEAGKPYVRRERFVDTWIYKSGNCVCVATTQRQSCVEGLFFWPTSDAYAPGSRTYRNIVGNLG